MITRIIKISLTIISLLAALPAFAQDFDYTYEGQTYTYTVIDPGKRTCGISKASDYKADGAGDSYCQICGRYYAACHGHSKNIITGPEFSISLPEHPIYEGIEYTLIELGDYAFDSPYHDHDYSITDYPLQKKLKSLTIPPSVKRIGKVFGIVDPCEDYGENVDHPCIDARGYYHLMPFPEEICVSSLEQWLSLDWEISPSNAVTSLTINGEKVEISGDIVIPEGIEKICDYKFRGCTGITSVTIPNSVTKIGEGAFYGCTGLTSVNIPNSVTSIGSDAFSGCSGLTSVTIPNSVTKIGKGAFSGCSGLTSVTIPNSVTYIGYNAFSGCSGLTKIEIEDLAKWYEINWWEKPSSKLPLDHVIFQGTEIPVCPTGDLVLPEGTSRIGDYAFYGCSGLTSVTIPNSVTYIGYNAFSGCSGLTEVRISDLGAWCKIKFWGYEYNPLYYAHHLILNGEEVKDLVIPNSVTEIGSYAFYDCTGLTSVTIPNSVTYIGSGAFKDCSGIVKAAYPNSISNPFSSNSSAKLICYNANSTISLPESGALYDESANSLLYVPLNASSVTIPEHALHIGQYAFFGCDNLQEIIALPFVTPPAIASDNFTEEQYENVRLIIPDGTYARYINSQWKNFKNIEVAKAEGDDNRFFDGVFSYSYSLNTKEATLIPGDYAAMTNAQIPNRIAVEYDEGTTFYNVTGIADGAFMNCKNLTTVKLPKNLTKIGDSAFQGCSALEAVSIPETVEEIGEYAFSGCSGLKTATLPSALTEIKDFLFMDCRNLETVNFPETLQRIGYKAFCDCASLTSIYLPEGLTEIGEWAFKGCSGLTSVTIPASVTSIDSGAFSGCSGLTSVTIPNSVTKIDDWAFSSCSMPTLNIPNSVTEIGWGAFYDCSALTSVTIPSSVEYIRPHAFNCPSLTSFEIADSHEPITLRNPFGIIEDYRLYAPIKTLSIGRPWEPKQSSEQGYLDIPTTLETLTLGNTVTEIPDKAFANLPNLTSVSFGGALESIGEQAFSGCNLQEVVIPPSVTFIGAEAFSGNSDLAEIKIGHGIEEIGERAFADCNNIANIYVTATTPPSAQNNTFSNYSSPLWLPDEETFELYYNYPRCWYRFEDNMFTLKPVESLSTVNNELTGNPGESIKLEVTVEPADATLPQIFWSSSDPSVATVDHEGKVTFTTEANDGISTLSDDEAEPKPTVKSCTITARSMHAEVPLLEITLNKTIGDEIVEISTPEIPADQDAPIEVYNLRGVKVSTSTDGLTPGIYIIRQGNKSRKVAI